MARTAYDLVRLAERLAAYTGIRPGTIATLDESGLVMPSRLHDVLYAADDEPSLVVQFGRPGIYGYLNNEFAPAIVLPHPEDRDWYGVYVAELDEEGWFTDDEPTDFHDATEAVYHAFQLSAAAAIEGWAERNLQEREWEARRASEE